MFSHSLFPIFPNIISSFCPCSSQVDIFFVTLFLFFPSFNLGSDVFWLGLRKSLDVSPHLWIADGSEVDPGLWGDFQPNGGPESCVAAVCWDYFKFHDYLCNIQHRYICEKPLI